MFLGSYVTADRGRISHCQDLDFERRGYGKCVSAPGFLRGRVNLDFWLREKAVNVGTPLAHVCCNFRHLKVTKRRKIEK